MGKLVLGKTPEQLEVERAKKEREQEAEIQAAILERQKKIQALHSKQKTNKIIIFSITFVIAAVLIVFGTYNTFFKKGLTTDDVYNIVNTVRYRDVYPDEGLGGYIRDNCESLFLKYYNDNKQNQGKDIASIEVDKDSCYIFNVRKLSPNLAQVFFSVDIIVTKNDTMVTDPNIIERLKRSGFGTDLSKTVEPAQTPTVAVQPEVSTDVNINDNQTTDENIDEENTDEENNENNETNVDNENNQSNNGETIAPTPTVIPSTTDNGIPTTSIDYKINTNGDAVHYYMADNGTIWQSGEVIRERYSFYVPIELAYQYDVDGTTPITAGYAVVDNMNLYSLVETDMTDFEEINTNSVFAFNEETILDDDTSNKMQTKVNNTLKALYDGTTDTSQDFLNYKKFNNYNASYVGIEEFKAYSQPNQLGYNVHVKYSIITSQGFKYTMETYMLVEQNGGTWVIKDFL